MNKNKSRRIILFLLIFSILATTSLATHQQPYHLKLLAVQESGSQMSGSDADLYLEIKEGSGRVFLDTYPATKMDTQISTRYAKEIACNHFQLDCDNYDFIFTIKAKSSTIGGPSAGAAIAALTTIGMLDLPYDQNIAITGTINSGGIVGPVGGIKEKLEAASAVKLKKVLIPKGSAISKEKIKPADKEKNTTEKENKSEIKNKIKPFNETTNINTSNENINIPKENISIEDSSQIQELNLINYSKENLSLEVIEVIDLEEVLFQFTGKDFNNKNITISKNQDYQDIMEKLKEILCERTEKILSEIEKEKIIINQSVMENINVRKSNSINATKEGDLYAAASYCFGNNIALKNYYYQQKKVSKSMLDTLFQSLQQKNTELELQLNQQKIETIAGLQTKMIVKERINEVKQQIEIYQDKKQLFISTEAQAILSYAEERFFSAQSWMEFFAMDGKKFILNNEQLANTCQEKLIESQERYEYVSLYLGEFNLLGIKEKMSTAQKAFEKKEFDLCITMASQAKADSNAILSSIGLDDSSIKDFFESKRKVAERIISQNSKEDIFPILGYSYYQYANSLKDKEPFTSLVYIEYALEMSDLSMYFPAEKKIDSQHLLIGYQNDFKDHLKKEWIYLTEGFLIGIMMTLLVMILYRTLKKK
jgi:uncharacterized protein